MFTISPHIPSNTSSRLSIHKPSQTHKTLDPSFQSHLLTCFPSCNWLHYLAFISNPTFHSSLHSTLLSNITHLPSQRNTMWREHKVKFITTSRETFKQCAVAHPTSHIFILFFHSAKWILSFISLLNSPNSNTFHPSHLTLHNDCNHANRSSCLRSSSLYDSTSVRKDCRWKSTETTHCRS